MGKFNTNKDALTPIQKAVAEEIAFKRFSGKTETQIAEEYHVDRTTIFRWKSKEAFNNEMNRIVKEFQKSNLVDVNATLIDILQNGNEKSKLKAIELYYRNQGLFKDNIEVKDVTENKVDINQLLEELKDM